MSWNIYLFDFLLLPPTDSRLTILYDVWIDLCLTNLQLNSIKFNSIAMDGLGGMLFFLCQLKSSSRPTNY